MRGLRPNPHSAASERTVAQGDLIATVRGAASRHVERTRPCRARTTTIAPRPRDFRDRGRSLFPSEQLVGGVPAQAEAPRAPNGSRSIFRNVGLIRVTNYDITLPIAWRYLETKGRFRDAALQGLGRGDRRLRAVCTWTHSERLWHADAAIQIDGNTHHSKLERAWRSGNCVAKE